MVNQTAQKLYRDSNGRFTKTPISTGGISKESQPNIEEIFLEEAQKTKELKEQLAELEKATEVQEIKGEVELPQIVRQAGVKQAGDDVPLSEETSVILPMDDTKIYKIVTNVKKFHQDIKSSATWLAYWCWRYLAEAHFKLKEVGGKVVRLKK